MIDIMAMFKEYLPQWSEKTHLPMPAETGGKYWAEAWKDFQKEYLAAHYSELTDFYNNLTLKTRGQQKLEQRQKEIEAQSVEPVEAPSLSEWEKVRKLLEED